MISDEYAAGFFDGEGCVYVGRQKRSDRPSGPSYLLKVQVGQSEPAVLRELRQRWGGTLSQEKRRHMWVWQIMSQKAGAFLRDIHSHTRVKSEQIAVALDFLANKGDSRRHTGNARSAPRTTPDEIARREWYYNELRRLKRRGRTAA